MEVAMKKALLISLMLLLAAGIFAERKALVIGNGAYANQTLTAPVNDSNAMASTLGGLGFSVTQANDLKLDQMTAVVDTFAAHLSPEDEVIFYYSGQGAHGTGSNNYLMPVDADPGTTDFYDYPSISLHLNSVLDMLKSAGTSVAIIDASRQWLNPKGDKLNLSFVWEGVEGENQMLVTSTGPDRVIPDLNPENSVFTQALVLKLNTFPESFSAIIKELTEELPKTTEGKYFPWYTGPLKNDLYLSPIIEKGIPDPIKSELEGGGSISW